jgi:tRNA threonylcarbamoyladenosine biosynthesis protein TsaE
MKIISHSDKETAEAGEKLAKQLKPGDLIALYGALGSGKTVFARGICRGLGCLLDVHSPTFNIINIYPGAIEVAHIDLYRVERCIAELDLDAHQEAGRVILVEWADKAKNDLPKRRFDIFFIIIDSEARELQISEPEQ